MDKPLTDREFLYHQTEQFYPYPCARCGYCCLAVTCPLGQSAFKVEAHDLCPGLTFEQDGIATCALATGDMKFFLGLGTGCCIKARAIKNGIEFDFAALSPELKIILSKHYRRIKHGNQELNSPPC